MSGLRSGELAQAAGVNQQTLRYYERRGLLPQPDRTLGGHRVYPDSAVVTLQAIKAVQRLGFTLDEVAELIDGTRHVHGPRGGASLRNARAGGSQGGAGDERTAVDVREHVATKLAEVEAKIQDLGVIRDALREALDAGCDDIETCTQTPECPLALAGSK